MREFEFELRLCARLERRPGIVARQLGASVGVGARVVDVLHVEPGPAFDDRVAITPETIPPAAIESDVGVGEWRPVTAALDGPPARARGLADRAVEAGFFERARRDDRDVVRQVARYPDWYDRLIGIENKPDLDRPGDLETQLRKDVSLGLLDRAILATASHVTGAHLNRIPEEVGVWRVDDEEIEVIREPTPLSPAEPGLQVVDRLPGRTEIRPVSAAEKARQRRRMAERAYGKGWRPGVPACARAATRSASGATLPYCEWKGRVVEPGAECGPGCDGHEAAAPPAHDPDAERAERTDWAADPDGLTRRQVGLDRFGT